MNYIHPSVSKNAVYAFYRDILAEAGEVYGMVIRHKGDVVVRYDPTPYDCETKGEVYSASKTFASTCIGIASDMGLLDVHEKLVDIFPDKLPDEVSDNLKEMTIHHIMTMDSGHSGCVMSHMQHAEDPVRAYLAQPVPYKPGTHFAYNTGSTCMLSLILQHKTGKTMRDFAEEYLMKPLGIQNTRWNAIDCGATEAGIGAQVSVDDLSRLMEMYRCNGVWKGKRVVSEDWVAKATSAIADNSNNGTHDWICGYGYQIWVNDREGYRADGACGQFSVVIPSAELVIALKANCYNTQHELDLIFALADNLFNKDMESVPPFKGYEPLPETEEVPAWADNKTYYCDKNAIGITCFNLRITPETFLFSFSDGIRTQQITAGNGYWDRSEIFAANMKPKLTSLHNANRAEIMEMASSYTVEDGAIKVMIRHQSCPDWEIMRLSEENGTVTVAFQCRENRHLPEHSILIGR